ncbi:MAG: hypothetical protein ACI9MR_001035 [Myxococcota bacterium]|jgi:hypothetical protein
MARPKQRSIWGYVKEAFLNHWNILLLGGAAVAGVISGMPEVVLPLVAAGELTYLGGLVSNERYRKSVDAKDHKAARTVVQTRQTHSLKDMLQGLAPVGRGRFLSLRQRCREMGDLARAAAGQRTTRTGVDTKALDRLLWAFLRLLYSKQALERFQHSTDADEIVTQLNDLRAREAVAKAEQDERVIRSLIDSIATAELRLSNYTNAVKNADFVDLELDRIEGKIRALTELAVSTEDPDYISKQVDSVAESMASTEVAIREIQHLTGFDDASDQAPEIMNMTEVVEVEDFVEA